MTCIAWDGKVLAADKAGTNAGYQRAVTKIFRTTDGSLVGFAGDGCRAMALLHWFNEGRKPEDYPGFQKNADETVGVLYVDKEGKVFAYGATPYPYQNEVAFDAIGSGRDYALATMYMGFGAKKAVEVATALDCYCGKGNDVLEL